MARKNPPFFRNRSVAVLTGLFLASPLSGYAIETRLDLPIGRQVMSAFSSSAVFMSLGGPNIRWRASELTSFHLGMIPSLKVSERMPELKLGVGLWCTYDKLIVGAPLYYEKNNWVPTIAFGAMF